MVNMNGWGEGGGGGGVENRAGGYSAQDKVIREVLERLLSTLAPTEGYAIRNLEPFFHYFTAITTKSDSLL